MKIRLVLQVGAYDKRPDDALKLAVVDTHPGELIKYAFEHLSYFDLKVSKVWRMGDNQPHLVEFEATNHA